MKLHALAVTAAAGAIATIAGCVPAPTTIPGYTSKVLAVGGSLSKPDDITAMGGRLYVSFQNGVGPKGEPSPNHITTSTVAEFDTAGHKLRQWNLTGKCDGLTADPANQRLIATVNEDGNSSLFTISPAQPTPSAIRHYQYSSLTHGGGTDSVTVTGNQIFVVASAPTANSSGAFTKPALYRVTLGGTSATTTPVLLDNSTAKSALTGQGAPLDLSDPDSSTTVPADAPRFAGDLDLDSQGDAQQIFLHNPGTPSQTATVLPVGTQINDTAFATSSHGTLYITDNTNNALDAISGTFKPGTAYVAAPSDSGVAGFVGVLNLTTGAITPVATNLASPAGLLFIPGP
jgi:hypothetical protein